MEHLSKKEQRKEQFRKEREMTVQDLEKKERSKKMMIWAGSAFILGGIIAILVWLTLQEGWVSGEIVPVDVAEDHWRGNPDASVSLVEYGDFQCGACGSFHPLLTEVKDEYQDRVLFVYRHFPLNFHPYADVAARATEAAALQDKDAFWQMHDMLFENQKGENSWVNADAEQIIIGYAEELGLDVEQFKNDLDSTEVKNAVKEDTRSGQSGDVAGTPTLFLNNKKIQTPGSVAGLKEVLDNALQEPTDQTPTTDEEQTQEPSDSQTQGQEDEQPDATPEDTNQPAEQNSESETQE